MRTDPLSKSIANQLRDYRRRRQLTQYGLAREWGVGFRSIQCWEQGLHLPRGLGLKTLREKLQDFPPSPS